MDHRVSKDMISSGMTPSGEKTQADLGKTQYGSAPSPNKLMDAYHSMYQDQKEQTLDEKVGGLGKVPKKGGGEITPKKQEMGIAPKKPYKEPSFPAPTDPDGVLGSRYLPTPYKGDATIKGDKPEPSLPKFSKTDNPGFKKPEKPKSMIDTVKDRRKEVEDKRGITARREKVQGIMSKYGESVDLLAAYRAVYEHHKKDEDGNTIPHEDDVKEGKIPAGLQAYLDKKKGKKKDDDDNGDDEKEGKKKDEKDVKEGVDLFDVISGKFINEGYDEKDVYKAMSSLTEEQLQNIDEAIPLIGAALGAAGKFVTGLGAKAAATGAGKILANTAAKKGIGAAAKKGTMMIGKKIGGTQGARIGARAADAFGKLDNFSKVQLGGMALNTAGNIAQAPVNAVKGITSGGGSQQQASNTINKTGRRTSVNASADLFDIVKGQLLDEGLSEEEIRDIMLELTPEEIMKEMNQGPSTPVSIDKVEFPKPGKKVMPKTGATYIGKVRPKPGFKMNPASGEVEKNENV